MTDEIIEVLIDQLDLQKLAMAIQKYLDRKLSGIVDRAVLLVEQDAIEAAWRKHLAESNASRFCFVDTPHNYFLWLNGHGLINTAKVDEFMASAPA
jgi:hypothetical protein